jgi:hypothetical protein
MRTTTALVGWTVERKFSAFEREFAGLPGQNADDAGSQNSGEFGNAFFTRQLIGIHSIRPSECLTSASHSEEN